MPFPGVRGRSRRAVRVGRGVSAQRVCAKMMKGHSRKAAIRSGRARKKTDQRYNQCMRGGWVKTGEGTEYGTHIEWTP